MKTITYTKMRDELADVLDALRNGEEVTITQRGRPDVVVSAKRTSAPVSQGNWRKRNEENKLSSPIPPRMVAGGKSGQVKSEASQGERVREYYQTSLSFIEAKEKTQKKHARIIKALEDK